MTTRKQILISTGIVGAAAVTLAIFAVTGTSGGVAEGGMDGHDHTAMMAAVGDELRPVRLDQEQARRIGLTFAEVESGPLLSTIRVVGIVSYDETRLVDLSPRVEGWTEELYVDFTGAPVRRGEPLLALYSPALVSAQEELILARRLADEMAHRGGRAAENARALLESARRRLSYWGITADQIEAIETRGEPRRALVLRAPAGGFIVEKNVVQGSRVLPGTNLYRIADLSRVWVEGEVFEKDLGLVEVGRNVTVSLDAYPGQGFEGTVTYIYPLLSAESRTGRIRVELPNPELLLKPGMYANLAFEAPVHLEGLHIPRSAVLTTGTRSVVFVRAADGALVPREITVGRAAGDQVEVLAGLMAGEIVVSSANFLVDAESNLGMALEGMEMGGPSGGHDEHDRYEAHRTPAGTTISSNGIPPGNPGVGDDDPAPASARVPVRATSTHNGH
jgi:Cu(I)/Ag(I) efflux system membrane fusion protein